MPGAVGWHDGFLSVQRTGNGRGEQVDEFANVGECVEASFFVRPDLPERELATRLAAYNLVSVAVCDEDARLLGAVTVDDVLDHLLPAGWRRTGV